MADLLGYYGSSDEDDDDKAADIPISEHEKKDDEEEGPLISFEWLEGSDDSSSDGEIEVTSQEKTSRPRNDSELPSAEDLFTSSVEDPKFLASLTSKSEILRAFKRAEPEAEQSKPSKSSRVPDPRNKSLPPPTSAALKDSRVLSKATAASTTSTSARKGAPVEKESAKVFLLILL